MSRLVILLCHCRTAPAAGNTCARAKSPLQYDDDIAYVRLAAPSSAVRTLTRRRKKRWSGGRVVGTWAAAAVDNDDDDGDGDIIILLFFEQPLITYDDDLISTKRRQGRRRRGAASPTPHRTPPTTTTTTRPSSFVRCSACARGRCATLAGVLPLLAECRPNKRPGGTRAALRWSASRNDDSSAAARWRSSLDR